MKLFAAQTEERIAMIHHMLKLNTTIFFGILFCLFFFSTSNLHAQSADQKITLIYTGNLDGELEPCGCSEGGNKGGIKRRAQALDELRKEDPNLYLISSGGLLLSEVAQDKLKSKYILKGMEALNYDAIGVQWKDLSYGTEFLNNTSLPFIMSNNSTQDFFKNRTISNKNVKISFFSWLDPGRNPQKNMNDPIAANEAVSLARELENQKSKNHLTILATTLPLKLAQRKLPLNNVDILLIKAKYEKFGEPQIIDDLLVLQPGSRGMRIGKLNLTVTEKGEVSDWQHKVIVLPPDVPDAPRMAEWYDAYNAAVKTDYEKRVAIRKKLESGESPFTGESSCKNCHAKQHEAWSRSRHSEAFYTLQDANKAFDPSCIKCHTVGFETPGGFIDAAITERLMHVQCENCHGAAKAHVDSAGKMPVTNHNWNNEKICGQCHVQKHSPEFNFDTYWPKIAH